MTRILVSDVIAATVKASGHPLPMNRGYGEPHVDFLLEQTPLAPNIITNPPFKLAREFAQHALDIGCEKVALLLKLAFMQGGDRSPWLFASGLRRVIVVSKRITFVAAPDRPPFTSNFVDGYGWFIWQRGHQGPAELVSA